MSEVSHIIGIQIKQNREKKNLNQKELAAIFEVSSSTVSGWEAGSFVPGSDVLVQLCEFFEITLDELFGREKNKPVENSDELRQEDIALLKSFTDIQQEEILKLLRQSAEEAAKKAVKIELDRRQL